MSQASQAVGVPDSIQASFQGTAAAFQSSTQNMGMLLVIAMIVVYIILGILYESFIHPLTILSGLPTAVFGALLTLWIFGKDLDLYGAVGPRAAFLLSVAPPLPDYELTVAADRVAVDFDAGAVEMGDGVQPASLADVERDRRRRRGRRQFGQLIQGVEPIPTLSLGPGP